MDKMPYQQHNRPARRARVLSLHQGPTLVEPSPTVHAALTRYAIVRRKLDLLAAIRDNTSEIRRLREALQVQGRSRGVA